MGKHGRLIGKGILFIAILFTVIQLAYRVIVPKFFYQDIWGTSATFVGFYQMEKDTVDVLFFGSSLSATAYIPQELYDSYGIASYNLACEQQNLVTTYFWLKEALGYQSPEVVVLDCHLLFPYKTHEPLNSPEVSTRKAFDYMRWSGVKWEAVKTICELDENQSKMSYYLPNIRYHNRWKDLNREDFAFWEMREHYERKGYAPLAEACGEGHEPFIASASAEEMEMVPLMKEYLDKITDLCKQEGISLVLTNVPSVVISVEKYNALQRYANEHDLLFLDFNEKALAEEIGFCYPTDSADGAHLNLWGAQKVTDYIGQILTDRYDVAAVSDEQWESTKSYYEDLEKDCALVHITDVDEYLTALKEEVEKDRYSVFLSGQGSYSLYLKEETLSKMRELGLEITLQDDPTKESFYCYYAVIADGTVKEYIGYDELNTNGTIRNGTIPYDITGTGSIMIEEAETSKRGDGINIVVYHNATKKVLDSVCFHTAEPENAASR